MAVARQRSLKITPAVCSPCKLSSYFSSFTHTHTLIYINFEMKELSHALVRLTFFRRNENFAMRKLNNIRCPPSPFHLSKIVHAHTLRERERSLRSIFFIFLDVYACLLSTLSLSRSAFVRIRKFSNFPACIEKLESERERGERGARELHIHVRLHVKPAESRGKRSHRTQRRRNNECF